jgi:hypothetical protein
VQLHYVSNAARERAEWLTLAEVVDWVRKNAPCDRDDQARQEIIEAGSDKKLILKWENVRDSIFRGNRRFWQSPDVEFDWVDSTVLDLRDPTWVADLCFRFGIDGAAQASDERRALGPNHRRRVLLVQRRSVQELWPAAAQPIGLERTEPREQSPPRRGRRPGQGSLKEQDEPFVKRVIAAMDAAQTEGRTLSACKACSDIADELPGSGAPENRAKRLHKRVMGRIAEFGVRNSMETEGNSMETEGNSVENRWK